MSRVFWASVLLAMLMPCGAIAATITSRAIVNAAAKALASGSR